MSYIKKYEYVLSIAQNGGISQAADELGISQPTLSKYIKKLESELGVELFDRSTIPIRPTVAGERFIEAGIRLIDMEHQLHKQLEEVKLNKNTVVKLGISPSRSPYLIPAIVDEYKKNNSNGNIVIKERTTAELNALLARGDIDLSISLYDQDSAGFEHIELFFEDILLAVPKELFPDTDSALKILQEAPLISVGSGLSLWQTMNETIRSLGIGDPEIECQSIESALALVKRGLGVMLVPSYVCEYGTAEQNKNLRFLNLPSELLKKNGHNYKRKVCLFYRKEQFLTQAEKDFIACVIKEVKKAVCAG